MTFKKIKIEDCEMLTRILFKYGENSCQHSFVSMFLMQDKYGEEYCIENDCLYIKRSGLGENVYLFPFGENAKLPEENICFETITESGKRWLEENYPDKFEFEEVRDYFEYIYKTDDLADLTGRALSKKRNHVKQFLEKYEGRFEVLCIENNLKDDFEDNLEAIRIFQKKWLADRIDSPVYPDLEKESEHIMNALSNWEKLHLMGIMVIVDGKIVGYSYGCGISDNCVDCICEKGDIRIEGIYQVVNKFFAQMVREKGYEYINREEDGGFSGLRQAKESYCPYLLLKKYKAVSKC